MRAVRRERGTARQDVRAGDVLHRNIITRLLPVPEDRERLARQEPRNEDGDHPRLRLGVLPGAADVRVAQRHPLEAVQRAEGPEVVLAGELAHAVRRHRPLGRGLGRGNDVGVAVHHAAAAREHDAPHAARGRPFQHVDEPGDVDVGVGRGMLDRVPDVDLRGVVVQHLEPAGGRRASREVGADVRDDERDAGGHLRSLAPGKVVQRGHVPARRQVRLDDVRADEAGAASHQHASCHALPQG